MSKNNLQLKKKTSTGVSSKLKNTSQESKKVSKELKICKGAVYATGKRKTSVARVWVQLGSGNFIINDHFSKDYFASGDDAIGKINQPFLVTNSVARYDVYCTVKGGGVSGQAGAICHGISKALNDLSSEYRASLKKHGLLTRDSRVVERKKYGLRKARKRSQFSKR